MTRDSEATGERIALILAGLLLLAYMAMHLHGIEQRLDAQPAATVEADR